MILVAVIVGVRLMVRWKDRRQEDLGDYFEETDDSSTRARNIVTGLRRDKLP